ncbi:PTS sugar transporter subunit IIC, partial [Clostridium haemolyticum]
WDNKLAVFYLLGFVLTAYLKLPAVAVAAIGIILCITTSQRDLQIANLPAIGSKTSGQMTKEDEEEDFFS